MRNSPPPPPPYATASGEEQEEDEDVAKSLAALASGVDKTDLEGERQTQEIRSEYTPIRCISQGAEENRQNNKPRTINLVRQRKKTMPTGNAYKIRMPSRKLSRIRE